MGREGETGALSSPMLNINRRPWYTGTNLGVEVAKFEYEPPSECHANCTVAIICVCHSLGGALTLRNNIAFNRLQYFEV